MWKKFGHIFKDNKLRSFDEEDFSALIAIGNDLYQKKSFKKALEYYNEAMAIRANLDIKEDNSLARTLHNMGEIYNSIGETSLASIYFHRETDLDKKLHEK